MILYIIKSIFCSAVCLLAYHLFLEEEKMHRFNRFYLLFCIIFSFIVPFISFSNKVPPTPVNEIFIVQKDHSGLIGQPLTFSQPHTNSLTAFLLAFYISVTSFLFLRFTWNIITLLLKVKNNKKITWKNTTLVLTDDIAMPFSFLHYIFVNKQAFESGDIEKEILTHELTHITQKHSLDIIFTELVFMIAWFNPTLYFYKKAIQLNHEFLADEGVLHAFNEPSIYQHLLINKAGNQSNTILGSSFNYLITKKRLIMITQKKRQYAALLKQTALLPLFAVIVFLFSTRITAQTVIPQQRPIESAKEDAPVDLIKEYNSILAKYKADTPRGRFELTKNITEEDKAKLETIYKQMSKQQQAEQTVIFVAPPGALKKTSPTESELNNFKVPSVYGIWIDGKKVNNTTLNNYKTSDFSQVFISKLYGPAKVGRNYTHQVNLMTNKYYQDYYNQTIATSNQNMIAIRSRPVSK